METLKYKRVLLKVSGEALAGDAEGHRGINFDVLESIAKVVRECIDMGVQIALCLHLQIDAGMKGEQGEHMVKEAHAGVDIAFSAAIQIHLHEDRRLFGLSLQLCCPLHHAFLLYVFNTLSTRAFSSSVPTVMRKPSSA